uniref:Uncharacterized protein LOC114913658 n=1 Tax=Elaeis guineensis var. tenera TaxID=51953 RepID=A0A8N4F0N8_ELAGV|nr:uncharacterized protein LOC114913658 [Elaeis guineensis]
MELLLSPKKRRLSLSCEEERQPAPTKKKARWQKEKTRKTPAVVDVKNRPFKKFAAAGAAPCRTILVWLGIHRPVLLFEKILFHSDVDREQNRLQVNEGVVESSPLMAMLTEEEESVMKNPKIGLPVTVLDPLAREYRMTLRKLGTHYYRFMGQYHKLVKNNKIEVHHILDIWGFRVRGGQQEGELRFAMLNYGQEETEDDGEKLTAREKEAIEALLELKKGPAIFQD